MTNLEAMLAAVLAEPADDIVRLAYADALEGTDTPSNAARAAFIRVQIELANYAGPCAGCGSMSAAYGGYTKYCRAVRCKLKRWEYECSKRFIGVGDWNGGFPGGYASLTNSDGWHRGFVAKAAGTLVQIRGGLCHCRSSATCFVARCVRGQVRGELRDIVREHPLESVLVTDSRLFLLSPSAGYIVNVPDLEGNVYASVTDARASLSRFLIDEAKELNAKEVATT